jgi:hypothetical protein
MKKLTALLLCFLLLCICAVPVLGATVQGPEEKEEDVGVSTTVPKTHKIAVTADSARVFYEGVSGDSFTVERLSTPRLLIRAESGKVIKTVMLNGVDVTADLHSGYLDLAPIYEDKAITITTEDEPAAPEDTYTVSGKVTLNGQPLANVDLELRSTLKTAKTDENGYFTFEDVEPGKHSLTALSESRVIGYLSFDLKEDAESDVSLLEDGTYTVSIDQSGAGVELNLVLNEQAGTIVPTEAQKIAHNLWWLWLLLALLVICIVVSIVIIYRKKKEK